MSIEHRLGVFPSTDSSSIIDRFTPFNRLSLYYNRNYDCFGCYLTLWNSINTISSAAQRRSQYFVCIYNKRCTGAKNNRTTLYALCSKYPFDIDEIPFENCLKPTWSHAFPHRRGLIPYIINIGCTNDLQPVRCKCCCIKVEVVCSFLDGNVIFEL